MHVFISGVVNHDRPGWCTRLNKLRERTHTPHTPVRGQRSYGPRGSCPFAVARVTPAPPGLPMKYAQVISLVKFAPCSHHELDSMAKTEIERKRRQSRQHEALLCRCCAAATLLRSCVMAPKSAPRGRTTTQLVPPSTASEMILKLQIRMSRGAPGGCVGSHERLQETKVC